MIKRINRNALLAFLALALLAIVVPVLPAAADVTDNLDALRNNVGIAQDPLSGADFDGGGFSYSGLALRLAGIEPGGEIESDDVTFTWPASASGVADNLAARGHELTFTGAAGASKLVFLGASSNGPATAPLTLTYNSVDETGAVVQTVVDVGVTFSDWTLNAGSSVPSAGNTIVATAPFRVANSLQPEQVDTHVFAITVPLDTTKILHSVKFPLSYNGQIHVFDVALNVPTSEPPPPPGPLAGVDNYVVAPPSAQVTGFATPVVAIPAGSGLMFANADNTSQHDVVSLSASGLPDGTFSSPYTNPSTTSRVDGVEKLPPGEYRFACSLHGTNMTGMLRVL